MIYLENRARGSGVRANVAARILDQLLDQIGERGSSVSLSFVRDAEMRELNRAHRGKDAPTDVLSFPIYPRDAFLRRGRTRPRARRNGVERLLGDIVISVDAAVRQAAAYDAPLQREIERLLIHGVLHLAGHDHHAAAEQAVMEAEERRLADSIGMPWPYLATIG